RRRAEAGHGARRQRLLGGLRQRGGEGGGGQQGEGEGRPAGRSHVGRASGGEGKRKAPPKHDERGRRRDCPFRRAARSAEGVPLDAAEHAVGVPVDGDAVDAVAVEEGLGGLDVGGGRRLAGRALVFVVFGRRGEDVLA